MAKNNLLRVTQLNAIFLDKEIEKLFLQIVLDLNKYLPASLIAPYQLEINLLVKLAILNYSIVKNGSTFGQQLLSIKYDRMGGLKKSLYVILNCLGYVRDKLEIVWPSHELNHTVYKWYLLVKVLELVNLTVFLRNGSKPQLVERILCLNQSYNSENVQRHFESKYLARELLWNGFIEVLVNILPLINIHKLQRNVRHLNPFRSRHSNQIATTVLTVHTRCAHCKEVPILPHHMGCAHVFCYVCLKGNQAADSKYECPLCEHRNPNILCDKVVVL